MGKWLYILSLFSFSTLANQLAIEVIEGAYPKLTFRIEALEQLELKAHNKASKNDQEQVFQISLPASSACVANNLQLLRGRLIAVEFAWNQSIQQQISILSQNQLWKDFAYRVTVPSSNPSCNLPNIELSFPSLSTFNGGWGRVNVNQVSGVNAHNFFVMQQVGDNYQFNLVSPNHTKA
ncbi:hypothetical protein SNR37_001719 [Agarivorans aestuarii]|uniref:Uncharacterized protein n=1 Tax=Agarivorans aestuarii TaxID=1563703 RepID=A0ABU7FZB5_9ALTE|nr:hypothetical protein [Agarivorans aestuarii]MEE1672398.1 hypothetical protein [Agarivorans aestuarii]